MPRIVPGIREIINRCHDRNSTLAFAGHRYVSRLTVSAKAPFLGKNGIDVVRFPSMPRRVSFVHDPSSHSAALARADVEALFREYYGPLCGFVRKYVGSLDVAEEVVQELFLRVWELRERDPRVVITRAYLYTGARNQAIMVLRHERITRDYAAAELREPEPAARGADAAAEEQELAHAMQRAIARLPEKCRLVFTLSRESGLTYPEIAEVLGISVKTVELHMGRALKSLRASLGGVVGG